MSTERTPEQIAANPFNIAWTFAENFQSTWKGHSQQEKYDFVSGFENGYNYRQPEVDELKSTYQNLYNTHTMIMGEVRTLRVGNTDLQTELDELKRQVEELKAKIRTAFAQYRRSEGCGCCESSDHDEHEKELGKLLEAQPFEDGSGYDWKIYIKP